MKLLLDQNISRKLLKNLQIIWLRTGNASTNHIRQLFKRHTQEIRAFGQDKTLGCLQIFD